MKWQDLKTKTLFFFMQGKRLFTQVVASVAHSWRSSVRLSDWQSPTWGQLKYTELFGRSRIALAWHAPAHCSHNRKSRCSWEIWQHNTWGDKAQHWRHMMWKVLSLLVFYSSIKNSANYSTILQLYQMAVVSGVAERINALLKDGHLSLSMWYAKYIWFPICMYA